MLLVYNAPRNSNIDLFLFIFFLVKIDKDSLEVVVDTIEHDIEADELPDLLPAATPRYLAYSYKYVHKEGQHERVSYPLVFIFYCPPGINPSLNMMYASTKQRLANALQIQKVRNIPFIFKTLWIPVFNSQLLIIILIYIFYSYLMFVILMNSTKSG